MSDGSSECPCLDDESSTSSVLTPHCKCPRDDHGILAHEDTCLMYRNEKMQYTQDTKVCACDSPPGSVEGVCKCCSCPVDRCTCRKSGRAALDEWRSKPIIAGSMPSVLDSNHPLMQKFQESLKQFLEKENAIAEEEILNLRDELRLKKESYDRDLETIYRSDHDTNQQRVIIEDYQKTLAEKTAERQAAEARVRETAERHKKIKDKLDQDIINEREASEELEALTMLCKQLEQWREETESDLTISHRMSDKMKAEKRALADEKRQLDMIIFSLGNEVWKLESKLELFKKQTEIKQKEMENATDKVTAYAAELEDLELDKRRLVCLWNSVLVNIQQRDRVYDSVREDYRNLQENYRTLVNNLEVTKKITEEEMNKGKEIAMNRDKLIYDSNAANKIFEAESAKKNSLETQIMQLTESIEMTERDENMIKSENQALLNILKSSEKEFDRKMEQKLKLENEILTNLQDCLLNDKAVESMANGIKKMREMSRKLEIALMVMENQHAKMMLDIEVHRNRQARNNKHLEETLSKVHAKEKEIDDLEEKFQQGLLDITKKQRELDLVNKKYAALKEIFDTKSPQERRVEELEKQIKGLRERTEELQREWLIMQGHVVKLSAQYQKLVTDVNLIKKQIQICEQKTMRIQAESENVASERARVQRTLRDLQGRLEVLERNRKEACDRNLNAQRTILALTHEYSANLKDAEMEIIQLEDDIEHLEKEKINLTQELDKVQREALIWQRKGILAVDLKKNMSAAKSAVGEIGKMRSEIHRMTVRREQLRKIAEKLADDLAQCVTRREIAMDKSRAIAALEKAHGGTTATSQSQYRHKLRLARADVARVTKDIAETKARINEVVGEQQKLEHEMNATETLNAKLEERVATLLRECNDTERRNHWILERVVRSQRLGSELSTAVKKQSIKVKKSKATIIEEYAQSRALNETMRDIVDILAKEYPNLEDKLSIISNTLNIYVREDVPQLSEEECLCFTEEEMQSEFSMIAEKPLEQ